MMLVNSSARTMESGIAEAAKPPVSGSIQKTEGSPESQQALVKQSSINIPYVKIRKDFRETAFFYSSLHTDSAGSLSLNFTAPETLTRWKLLGLAHTRNLEYGLVEKELVTQKELMVFPNTPRFVRQGDTVVFSSKISNLSSRDLTGTVNLELRDALTQKPIDSLMNTHHQQWTAALGQSTSVTWQIIIPANSELSVLQCRITASSGIFSDGEEQAIPVLGNRWLVTESLPLPVRGSGTREFRFEKLLNSGPPDKKNSTLNNYRLTLEFASNPAWYAIEALPSLDNKTFENADAVFSSFYSNSLASYIANSNPKIKAVFESWKTLSPDALQSNLVKNQTLKSVLIQETPWVLEAKNETERKQKLGMYFDLNNLSSNLAENLKKLQKLQKPSGGWVWFEGMPENRWISQKIITGMGHLDHLGVNSVKKDADVWKMIVRGIRYLDDELLKDYENQKKYNKRSLDQNNLSATQIQYLYARSYFASDLTPDIRFMTSGNMEAFEYYRKQAEKYWLQNDRYLQGMIALALNRLGDKKIPALILKSLSEKALHSDEMGMYWAQDRGYYWYQAPIEAQALMIEAFDEVIQNEQAVEDLKIWLLKQKQTRNWDNTCATAEACYALLLRGTDLLSSEPGVKISVGKEKINSDKLTDIRKEAGTGYFQCSWSGKEITPDMGNIRISKSGPGVGWGALYWQYFENLDKISPAALPLKLERKLFIERNTSAGPILEPAHQLTNSLTVGDKLVVRIVLTVDRDLEFVHMKDLRASCFEPWFISPQQGPGYGMQNPGSGYRFQNGLGYYQSSTDVATNFFFDYLPKGTHVFEYRLNVSAAGEYSNGITTIQCLYAPEFSAHSDGFRVHVK